MRLYLLAVLLISSISAMAGELCPAATEERTSPCTAYAHEQRLILKYIQAGVDGFGEYETAVVDEKLLREEIQGFVDRGVKAPLEKGVEWEKANKKRIESRIKMDSNLNRALELTSRYYGLGHNARGIAKGPLSGYGAEWKPLFLYATKDEQGRYKPNYLRRSFRDEPEKEPHYMAVDFGDPKDGNQAFTLEDGSTLVSIEAFKRALDPSVMSPRLLATTLFHERVHLTQLFTVGSENKEKDEVEACVESLNAVKTFELTEDERTALEEEKQAAELDLDEVESGAKRPTLGFTSEFQRSGFAEKYEKVHAEWKMDDEQREFLKAALSSARKLEEQKEEERQKEQRTAADRLAQAGREVQRCGFIPKFAGDLLDSFSRERSGLATNYYFTAAVDMEGLKVNLLLAFACGDVDEYGGFDRPDGIDRTQPCNEGLEIINRRWSEPGFKDKTRLEGQYSYSDMCLEWVHSHIKPPVTMRDLTKQVQRARREYLRNLEKLRARRPRTQPDKGPRGDRGENDRPRPGYDPCIDPGNSCFRGRPPRAP